MQCVPLTAASVLPSLRCLEITQQGEVKYTLIMTYMKSGSTITSRLLKTNDTFFFFEPFFGLLRDHRTDQHVCYPHGFCRSVK
uniref:Uncharacterized protein n=1 Tax=Magallana gigas TaxID=29159 RepID=K1RG72_MAGGI